MTTLSPHQERALSAFRCVRCMHRMNRDRNGLRCYNCAHAYPILADGIVDVTGKPSRRLTLAQWIGQMRVVAKLYDRLWRTRALSVLTGKKVPPREEFHRMLDAIMARRPRLVLDNACANAYYGRALARRMKRLGNEGVVIANDISLPMLRTARSLARQEHVADRILLVRSDSELMPFLSSTFDGAVCGGTLNEFRDPERVLAELHRVLEPEAPASMMMQVAAPDRIGHIQKMLGRIAGLVFPTAKEAVSSMLRHFKVTVTLNEGAVLMVRLASR